MSSLRIHILKFQARCVLTWEMLSLWLWRGFVWAVGFAGLWLFQIPAAFGGWVEGLAAVAFFAGFVYWVVRDFRHYRRITRHDVERRLERDSALEHRPLSSFGDKPVHDEPHLWARAQLLKEQLLNRLRPARLRSVLVRRDPYALRLAVVVLFISGMMVAGYDWDQRLSRGVFPFFAVSKGGEALSDLHVTLTPPKYTKLAQLALTEGNRDKNIQIPAGTTLKAIVNGGFGTPKLVVGDERFAFVRDESETASLKIPVPSGTRMMFRRPFRTLGDWEYTLLPDNPPELRREDELAILPDALVQIPLIMSDDYGVTSLTARIALDPMIENAPIGKAVSETRAVYTVAEEETTLTPSFDWTSHSWAGLPIVVHIEVADHLGQTAFIDPIHLTLPEKQFQHPVAKRLIEIRQTLAWEPLSETEEMGSMVEEFLYNSRNFQNNPVIFLALRSLASRMYWSAPSEANAQDLIATLWDVAVAIEDGNITLARRNMKEAQRVLEDVLRDPEASKAEIAQAMSEFRQAMAAYMQEVQRELQKRMAEGQTLPHELAQNMIDPELMANFLDQLEQEMLAGNLDKVREMMAQLGQLMDRMNPNMAEIPDDMKMMDKGINELQELIEKQEKLLKQTENIVKRQSVPQDFGGTLQLNNELMLEWGLEDAPPPPKQAKQPQINTQDKKTEQEALRFILGQLMLEVSEKLDDIPENMGLAEQAMRGSSEELGENAPRGSVPYQVTAIEELKKAQEELSQQLMQRMQQFMAMGGGAGMKFDPLGRPYGGDQDNGGLLPGSDVKIPDASERKKALEILKELRKRSGERGRERKELDYLQRLMRQF